MRRPLVNAGLLQQNCSLLLQSLIVWSYTQHCINLANCDPKLFANVFGKWPITEIKTHCHRSLFLVLT